MGKRARRKKKQPTLGGGKLYIPYFSRSHEKRGEKGEGLSKGGKRRKTSSPLTPFSSLSIRRKRGC